MADDPLDEAAKSLADFASGPVAETARSIEESFERTFTNMERVIARAVTSGKLSMADFASSVLADFDRIATRQYLTEPLQSVLTDITTALLPVAGARAAGGPVEAGSAYLVGENGPELFTPDTRGTVSPHPRSSVTLNVQARDVESFKKSESQLAAMLTRALARGQRNL